VDLILRDWVSGDKEWITLSETQANSGVFHLPGGIPTAAGNAVSGDGILQTSPGSWLLSYWNDPDFPGDWWFTGIRITL
jgi:hypothetical protein